MRKSNVELQNIAIELAPRFSEVVCKTGTLTPDQMKEVIKKARLDGLSIPNIGSDRSLQIVNEAYCSM